MFSNVANKMKVSVVEAKQAEAKQTPQAKKSRAQEIEKFQGSFISFLEKRTPDRVFSDYPMCCTDEDLKKFQDIFKNIKNVVRVDKDFFDLADEKDKEAIKKWVQDIVKSFIPEMLDGFGYLKWSWITNPENPSGIEKYSICYQQDGVNDIIAAKFFSICMVINCKSSELMNDQKNEQIVIAFLRCLKKYQEWCREVLHASQAKENRSLPVLMQALKQDYAATFKYSLWRQRAKEQAILVEFAKYAAVTEKSKKAFFTEMYERCVAQGLQDGLLARVAQHYIHKTSILARPVVTAEEMLQHQAIPDAPPLDAKEAEAKSEDCEDIAEGFEMLPSINYPSSNNAAREKVSWFIFFLGKRKPVPDFVPTVEKTNTP